MCAKRWSKIYVYQEHPRLADQDTNFSPLLKPVITKSTKQLLTVQDKRKYVTEILNDILVSCSESSGTKFEEKIKVLIKLKESWKLGKKVDIFTRENQQYLSSLSKATRMEQEDRLEEEAGWEEEAGLEEEDGLEGAIQDI